ncbi:S8 family peptidase [Bordetella genomosp. 13]|uniref:S8 family peptidase n=1 Tax=Bordetella genomosp. 13 TaxID=463040 RepID=UPI00119EA53F|nr:S8 family serine peptidase [Bordetella genomosp. 13]
MGKYIVLRGAPPRSGGPALPPGVLTAEGAGADMRIEVENVEPGDVAELSRDPTVRLLTPAMATRLIKPLAGQASAAGDAWGIAAVGADVSSCTGMGVTVAVLDTGIDASHPAFAGMTLDINDFTSTGRHDGHGHGTHCAGTIFGRDVDGRRIGVARGVQHAFIGKVLDDQGSGSSDMIFQALQWALRQRANVISMSLGFDFPGSVQENVARGSPIDLATSQALVDYRANLRMFDVLMAAFRAHNAFGAAPVVIAASGNESRRDIHSAYTVSASLPAAADGVIPVGAAYPMDVQKYAITVFSNTMVHLAAPGLDVLSAWPGGGLRALNGTSMACPHVAGVAALWWQWATQNGQPLLSQAVSARLTSSARPIFAPEFNASDFGFGLVTSPP